MAHMLLEVRELKKYFPITRGFLKRVVGWLKAVDGVSLSVAPGEIFGLGGESGCGKSTLSKTILGLHRPTAGEVRFEGRTISHLPAEAARQVRRDVKYVYQDPGASLDPWWTVGRSIREALVVHTTLSRPEMRRRVEEVIFISQDLGIIRLMCDRVTVMYLGAIVQSGPTEAIFRVPTHPYTQALLAAVPKSEVGPWEGTLLQGEPPRPDDLPGGCRFRRRCPHAQDDPCARDEPLLQEVAPGHTVACHLADKPSTTPQGAGIRRGCCRMAQHRILRCERWCLLALTCGLERLMMTFQPNRELVGSADQSHRCGAAGSSRRGARRNAPGAFYSGTRVDCQATICHCPPLLT